MKFFEKLFRAERFAIITAAATFAFVLILMGEINDRFPRMPGWVNEFMAVMVVIGGGLLIAVAVIFGGYWWKYGEKTPFAITTLLIFGLCFLNFGFLLRVGFQLRDLEPWEKFYTFRMPVPMVVALFTALLYVGVERETLVGVMRPVKHTYQQGDTQ